MYPLNDADIEILGEIAGHYLTIDEPQRGKDHRIKVKTRYKIAALIRKLCDDKPIERMKFESAHNARIRWLNKNIPDWNKRID